MRNKNRIYFKFKDKEIYSREVEPENALKIAAAFGVVWITAFIVLLIGWIINIVKLIEMPFDPITVEMIIRLVGVVLAPLGAFMGYFF